MDLTALFLSNPVTTQAPRDTAAQPAGGPVFARAVIQSGQVSERLAPDASLADSGRLVTGMLSGSDRRPMMSAGAALGPLSSDRGSRQMGNSMLDGLILANSPSPSTEIDTVPPDQVEAGGWPTGQEERPNDISQAAIPAAPASEQTLDVAVATAADIFPANRMETGGWTGQMQTSLSASHVGMTRGEAETKMTPGGPDNGSADGGRLRRPMSLEPMASPVSGASLSAPGRAGETSPGASDPTHLAPPARQDRPLPRPVDLLRTTVSHDGTPLISTQSPGAVSRASSAAGARFALERSRPLSGAEAQQPDVRPQGIQPAAQTVDKAVPVSAKASGLPVEVGLNPEMLSRPDSNGSAPAVGPSASGNSPKAVNITQVGMQQDLIRDVSTAVSALSTRTTEKTVTASGNTLVSADTAALHPPAPFPHPHRPDAPIADHLIRTAPPQVRGSVDTGVAVESGPALPDLSGKIDAAVPRWPPTAQQPSHLGMQPVGGARDLAVALPQATVPPQTAGEGMQPGQSRATQPPDAAPSAVPESRAAAAPAHSRDVGRTSPAAAVAGAGPPRPAATFAAPAKVATVTEGMAETARIPPAAGSDERALARPVPVAPGPANPTSPTATSHRQAKDQEASRKVLFPAPADPFQDRQTVPPLAMSEPSEARFADSRIVPAPLNAPPRPEALTTQIVQRLPPLPTLADRDAPLELTLDPPELGAIRLSVTRGAEGLVLHLQADLPETLELLRRHGGALAQELQRQGLDHAGFSFSSQHEGGRQARSGPAPVPTTEDPTSPRPSPPSDPQAPVRPDRGGLDLRL